MSSTSEPLTLPATKARWSRDAKVIGLVAVAHFMSHVHGMLLPPILGQVKAFGVTTPRSRVALTARNVVGGCLQTRPASRSTASARAPPDGGGLILAASAPPPCCRATGVFVIASLSWAANTIYHPADF
jgi:hypothetical protein